MADLIFEYPVKTASGKIRGNVSSRTKFGKSHSYTMRNPYKGPIAPERQQTIDRFRWANEQTSAILRDAEQVALWQERYAVFLDEIGRNPLSHAKRVKNLRGFIFSEIYQTWQPSC